MKRLFSWKVILLMLLELGILLVGVQYIRKGELRNYTVINNSENDKSYVDLQNFSLPRGSYVYKIDYHMENKSEDGQIIITNHDSRESGNGVITIICSGESNYAETEVYYYFSSSDYEVSVNQELANVLIDKIVVEQTSRSKKLDLLGLFVLFCLLDIYVICTLLVTKNNSNGNQIIKSNRIVWIEALRILASFAVVINHVANAGKHMPNLLNENGFVSFTFYHVLGVFAVPCFFMISGALMLNPKKDMDSLQLVKKHVCKVVFMYIFWSAMYAIYEMVIEDNYIAVHSFILKLLRGKDTLWFLPAIAGLYLLTPILRKIVEDKKILIYGIIICLIFNWLPSMLQPYENFSKMVEIVHRFSIEVGYVGYYLLGYFLVTYPMSKRNNRILFFSGIIAFFYSWIGSVICSRMVGASDGTVYNYNSLNVVVFSCAIFVEIKNFKPFFSLQERMKRKIYWLADKTAGIYMVHMFFNGVVTAWLMHCGYKWGIIIIPITAVIVYAFSLIWVTFIRKIPEIGKRVV